MPYWIFRGDVSVCEQTTDYILSAPAHGSRARARLRFGRCAVIRDFGVLCPPRTALLMAKFAANPCPFLCLCGNCNSLAVTVSSKSLRSKFRVNTSGYVIPLNFTLREQLSTGRKWLTQRSCVMCTFVARINAR